MLPFTAKYVSLKYIIFKHQFYMSYLRFFDEEC